jgi:hypothetical protein
MGKQYRGNVFVENQHNSTALSLSLGLSLPHSGKVVPPEKEESKPSTTSNTGTSPSTSQNKTIKISKITHQ